MREIKFRIYDKQFKKWITLEYYKNLGTITVEKDGALTLGSAFRFTDSMMICPKSFDVMQYTGLKGKNGKEIYEGDIVYIFPEYELRQVKWDKNTARFTVEYSNIITDFDNWYGKDLEVVGNIYDNPELLEEK